MLEVYEFERELNVHTRRKKRKKTPVQGDRRLCPPRYDNIIRKRKEFSRLVRANLVGIEKPALLTLTMYEVSSLKSAYKVFTIFIQRLRLRYGSDFRYITVPEFQKRGAVHFHMILWVKKATKKGGLLEKALNKKVKLKKPKKACEKSVILRKTILQERKQRIIQNMWQYGYVDSITTDGNVKLVGYLTKYMSKSLQDVRLMGQKSYIASRNILRPVSIPFKAAVGFSKDLWNLDLSTALPLHEKHFPTQWLGKGRYRQYKI